MTEVGLARADGTAPVSSEAGETLVEVLVAVVIMGMVLLALITAFETSIVSSGYHAQTAEEETVLRSYVESLKPRAIDSITTTSGSAVITAGSPSFTGTDVGRDVIGAGIPIGARISSVLQSGMQATMSTGATASSTSTTVTVGIVTTCPLSLLSYAAGPTDPAGYHANVTAIALWNGTTFDPATPCTATSAKLQEITTQATGPGKTVQQLSVVLGSRT